MKGFLCIFLLNSCVFLTSGKEELGFALKSYMSNTVQTVFRNGIQLQQIRDVLERALRYNRLDNATLNNTIMKEFFEDVQAQLPSSFAIPDDKMDSYVGNNINVYAAISGGKVVNLTNYNVDNVNITMSVANVPESLETWFSFPPCGLVGNYELDVSSPDIHIFGDGPFSITLYNMTVYTKSIFSETSNNNLNMTDFYVEGRLGSAQVDFENLLDGGDGAEAINSLASELILDGVVAFQGDIQKYSKQFAIPIINAFLALFSVPDLIDFIIYIVSG